MLILRTQTVLDCYFLALHAPLLVTGGKGAAANDFKLGGGIITVNEGYNVDDIIRRLSIIDSTISDNDYTVGNSSVLRILGDLLSQGAVTIVFDVYVQINSSVITNNSRGLTTCSSCGFSSDIMCRCILIGM